MSGYFNYILLYWVIIASLIIAVERLRFGPLWLLAVTWMVPVTLSQNLDLTLNEKWGLVTFLASSFVIFGFLIGYITCEVIFGERRFKTRITKVNSSKLDFIYFTLGALCIFAFLYLYFVELGSPPLLADGISEARRQLLTSNPILFSVTQLCNILAVIFGISWIRGDLSRVKKGIWFIIFICVLLSAWRNQVLTYLVYTVTPYLGFYKPKVTKVAYYLFIFLILFSLIGFVRGDQGDGSGFEINAAIELISLYIYPNFINFQQLQQTSFDNFSLYTLQFIFKPIISLFGGSVSPEQAAIGAFNVSTGLSPLYQDGGLANIFLVFVSLGVISNLVKRGNYFSPVVQFITGSLISTFLLLHNGWFLLNFMFTYSLIAYVVISYSYEILKKQNRKVNYARNK